MSGLEFTAAEAQLPEVVLVKVSPVRMRLLFFLILLRSCFALDSLSESNLFHAFIKSRWKLISALNVCLRWLSICKAYKQKVDYSSCFLGYLLKYRKSFRMSRFYYYLDNRRAFSLPYGLVFRGCIRGIELIKICPAANNCQRPFSIANTHLLHCLSIVRKHNYWDLLL